MGSPGLILTFIKSLTGKELCYMTAQHPDSSTDIFITQSHKTGLLF